jgi:LPS-assembly protein
MNKRLILLFLFLIISFNKIINLKANDDTYINSSNIIYNEKENVVELADNSKINFKNTNILIDKGIIDYNQDKFEVFGNFYLYEELTILSGQNLKGSTSLEIFSANNVSYIYNDDLKIDSDKLNRKKNIVYFYNNFLTPCELNGYFNCPTWSLRIDKTEYNIKQDKFTHFDTFLQIADYKIFYLPYLSHYGAKAPRKKGFLTPTLQFTVGGDQGVIIPYYFPINPSTDILFKPKITLNENFEILEKYQLNTLIKNKRSGGATTISIDNIKNANDININNSIRIDTKQVISKNNVISASGLFTNSISTTRSINEEPTTFEDIFLRSENYDILNNNDYFKIELSSVESFESTDLNAIPISPSLNYYNNIHFKNYSLTNLLDFTILKRNESAVNIPSESFKLKFNSELINNYFNKNLSIYNKVVLNNSVNNYNFNKNESLNHESNKGNMSLSSDIHVVNSALLTPRLKIIYPLQLINTNKEINEDSESITFNYQNQFSENRFFGNDLFDTSPRIVYAIESNYNLNNYNLNFNINQTYENIPNNSYLDKINQKSNFSDYAIEAKLDKDNLLFKIDSRLAQSNLSKKEMNYSIYFEDPFNLSLIYNETQSEAFKNQSNDTQSINFSITKKLNENINLGYSADLDVKNNYDPYKSSLQVSLFDECSQLDLNYSNTRFNDNFNTQPEETISLTFSMEYLGFFGYEQSTNLFFSEPGSVNYGL